MSCWQCYGLAGRAELYGNVTNVMIVDDLCAFTGDDCHDRREAFDDQNFECYNTLFLRFWPMTQTLLVCAVRRSMGY